MFAKLKNYLKKRTNRDKYFVSINIPLWVKLGAFLGLAGYIIGFLDRLGVF